MYSMFFGNLFVFFQFQGKTHIDEQTRTLVFSVLIAVGILGFLFLTALRPVHDTQVSHANDIEADDDLEKPSNGVVVAFRNSVKLFFTKEMLLLSLTFFYTGKFSNSSLFSLFCYKIFNYQPKFLLLNLSINHKICILLQR